MVVTTYGVLDDCAFKANEGYAVQMDNAGGKYKPLLSRNTYFHGLNVTSPNGQVMCGDTFETYLGTEYDPVSARCHAGAFDHSSCPLLATL